MSYAIATGRDLKCQETGCRSVFQGAWCPDPIGPNKPRGADTNLLRGVARSHIARPGRWVCGPTLIGISSRLKRNLVRVAFITPRVEFLALAIAKQFDPLPLFLKGSHYTTLEPMNIGCDVLLGMPKCQAATLVPMTTVEELRGKRVLRVGYLPAVRL